MWTRTGEDTRRSEVVRGRGKVQGSSTPIALASVSEAHAFSMSAFSSFNGWWVATRFVTPWSHHGGSYGGTTAWSRFFPARHLSRSHLDFLAVVTPNPEFRDDSLVKCKDLGNCAGCQNQMLSYEKPHDFKWDIVVKEFSNFSDLRQSTVLPTESAMPWLKQYDYRTKITPHFDAAPAKSQHSNLSNPQKRHG
ncbi:hypothetical protein B0H11DRAFT_2210754 [Mycena galericulata]|nr:hypothetical protein B0H11DRAFT_2210754 [Mycena galericulata]